MGGSWLSTNSDEFHETGRLPSQNYKHLGLMNTNKVYNINIFSTNLKIYIYKMKICLENITHAVSPGGRASPSITPFGQLQYVTNKPLYGLILINCKHKRTRRGARNIYKVIVEMGLLLGSFGHFCIITPLEGLPRGCAEAQGKSLQGGPYDIIIVKGEKQCYILHLFITYYPTLTQLGSIFSVKQSCTKKF
jgi:hypothetical protein